MKAAMSQQAPQQGDSLKLLPAYTRVTTLQDALQDPRSLRILWLEILFNDRLDLASILEQSAGQAAYQKACRWYTNYRSLIQAVTPRTPLPLDPGPIDHRDYRTFIEALHFVSPHP